MNDFILNNKPTVFVVDDDEESRHSISQIVRSVHLRVEGFSSAYEFLRHYSAKQAGCLVLDTRMSGMTGLELQSDLAAREVLIPIIIISDSGDISTVTRAMRAGAIDFLLKPCSSDILLERINEALKQDAIRREEYQQRAAIGGLLDQLTSREREVLDLLIEGCNSRQIASHLGLSPKTVDNHRAKILGKLRMKSIVKLAGLMVRYAS